MSWMSCGTAPALRTAVCVCGRPAAESACNDSRVAAATSVLPIAPELSMAASGEAAPGWGEGEGQG
eukprot:scaffold54889_cov44-Phaeocystis_antarctica.AAC.1